MFHNVSNYYVQTYNGCVYYYRIDSYKCKKSFIQNEEGYRDGRLLKTSETRVPHPIPRVPYPIPISLFFYNWSRPGCC